MLFPNPWFFELQFVWTYDHQLCSQWQCYTRYDFFIFSNIKNTFSCYHILHWCCLLRWIQLFKVIYTFYRNICRIYPITKFLHKNYTYFVEFAMEIVIAWKRKTLIKRIQDSFSFSCENFHTKLSSQYLAFIRHLSCKYLFLCSVNLQQTSIQSRSLFAICFLKMTK